MTQKTKPPKRQKPNKTKIKDWLKSKGHPEKPDTGMDEVAIIADAHGVLVDELRRLIK